MGRGLCVCGGRRKSARIRYEALDVVQVKVSAYRNEMAELSMLVIMLNELIHNKYIEVEVLV